METVLVRWGIASVSSPGYIEFWMIKWCLKSCRIFKSFSKRKEWLENDNRPLVVLSRIPLSCSSPRQAWEYKVYQRLPNARYLEYEELWLPYKSRAVVVVELPETFPTFLATQGKALTSAHPPQCQYQRSPRRPLCRSGFHGTARILSPESTKIKSWLLISTNHISLQVFLSVCKVNQGDECVAPRLVQVLLNLKYSSLLPLWSEFGPLVRFGTFVPNGPIFGPNFP